MHSSSQIACDRKTYNIRPQNNKFDADAILDETTLSYNMLIQTHHQH